MTYTLHIANKNYSSWSLRPWVLMKVTGIPFEERNHRFVPDVGGKSFSDFSPTGKVPLLVDGDTAVWDSLAIVEYLAEQHPDKRIWPSDPRQRARARSLCAEMHSGFSALRERFPMNIEASLAEIGAQGVQQSGAVKADLERIEAMWRQQLVQGGGPYLFGAFSAADAFFAPVCARIRTYVLPVEADTLAYVQRIFDLPSMQAWCTAARAEHDFIVEDEPYRTQT